MRQTFFFAPVPSLALRLALRVALRVALLALRLAPWSSTLFFFSGVRGGRAESHPHAVDCFMAEALARLPPRRAWPLTCRPPLTSSAGLGGHYAEPPCVWKNWEVLSRVDCRCCLAARWQAACRAVVPGGDAPEALCHMVPAPVHATAAPRARFLDYSLTTASYKTVLWHQRG